MSEHKMTWKELREIDPLGYVTKFPGSTSYDERDKAAVQLTALRAQAALLDDYAATIRQHEIRIAELEQAVEQARDVFSVINSFRALDIADDYAGLVGGECGYTKDLREYAKRRSAWLTQAPAQPEQEQAG